MSQVKILGKDIPVTLRQSDRNGANQLMELLKKKILAGEFPIALPTARVRNYVERVEKNRDVPKK